MKKDVEGKTTLVSLYMDDLIILGSANGVITSIKEKLSQVFDIKYFGQLHYCLGLEIQSLQDSFILSAQS